MIYSDDAPANPPYTRELGEHCYHLRAEGLLWREVAARALWKPKHKTFGVVHLAATFGRRFALENQAPWPLPPADSPYNSGKRRSA